MSRLRVRDVVVYCTGLAGLVWMTALLGMGFGLWAQ